MAKLTCPACEKRMGLLAFLKAPTPWHLKCNYCGVSLKLSRLNWACLVAAIVIGVVLGVSSVLLYQYSGIALVGIFIFIVGVVLFELAVFNLLPGLGVRLEKK